MPATVRFGAVEIKPATQQLLIGGVPAALGARAFDLLLALIERRDRLVAKHELLDIVWRDRVVEEGNLHLQVSTLRKLLGPQTITTVPGRGYRFVAALQGDHGEPAGAPDDAPAPSGPPLLGPKTPTPAPSIPGMHLLPLLGRETELQAVLAKLEAHRLVTIVGAAGMGKTALAQAAAQALRGRWRDGAWWVDLASVNDPAQVPHVVAQALRIARPASGSVLDHLAGVLASMSLLVVLDNCEHLVDAAGALAERIVSQASGVHVLATSQELLNVPGETLFKLAPLALADVDMSAEQAGQCGAIQLFVERARSADARFVLSAENAEAVADICRRLDGLPLAIELAAARVRLLGVQGLRDKLGERFRVLTGGARTAMRRHQTLQAAIDWSHALLSAPEQVVLRRLGLFVGGFGLELAQAVAQDEGLDGWAVLGALGGLVDKSLVIADGGEGAEPPRYRLLESTRAYALEKLAAAGETDAWLERHAQAVCGFFERTDEARRGEQGTLSNVEFVRRTAPELLNARAALDWAGSEAGNLNLAVGLAAAAALVYNNLSMAVEALDNLMRLRGRIDDSVSPSRAALFWTGVAAMGQAGRLPLATGLDAAHRAEHLYRAQGMPKRLHLVLAVKAVLLTLAGDWRSAQALLPEMRRLEESEAPARATSATSANSATPPTWPVWRIAERVRAQGWIHIAQGQFEQALALHQAQRVLMLAATGERHGLIRGETELCRCLCLSSRYDECIALARVVVAREGSASLGDMPVLLRFLMTAQTCSGRIDDARQTLIEAMPAWRSYGVYTAGSAMAVVLAELGCWADAARVGAAAFASQRRSGFVVHPSLQSTNERLQALLAAAACESDDLQRWQREGQALDEAAIEAICLRAVQATPGGQGDASA